MNQEHLCKDCGKPMELIEQAQINGNPPIQVVTCKQRDCTMWSVTLSVEGYEALTDEQFADYRKMVASLKATIAKRSI